MGSISMKKELAGTVEEAVERVTKALQEEGFGILTRIDLHEKFREKLGKEIQRTVILGACNPPLAYEAFTRDTDTAALIPCNAVIRELGGGRISVELAKPSALLGVLGNRELAVMAEEADGKLADALGKIGPA